jgi:asparagine synthase (glutamine-hydrolysing)
MCGILGSTHRVSRSEFEHALSLMRHRGPDDSGVETVSTHPMVTLGHQRLSILDLSSAGHQPMTNSREDSSLWITFNGEIYNFPALRRELETKQHRFSSRTDTEVLLHLYEEKGVAMLDELEGMFAFGIWDDKRKSLLLARDRMGVKPLYYTADGPNLHFASEIKSLLAFKNVGKDIDLRSLDQYLTFLWVPDPFTMLKNIRKLPPGHFLLWKDGRIKVEPYWEARFPPSATTSPNGNGRRPSQSPKALRELFNQVVRDHLISDVPLGAFLSGGLDSSAIVAEMSRVASKPVTVFSVGFSPRDQKYEIVPDDLVWSRKVADTFHLDYKEIILEPKMVDTLPKVIWHMDEPVADPAAISAYLICQTAKGHLKVLLSGMGADEIFGGYPRHVAAKIAWYYRKLPHWLRKGIVEPAIRRLPGSGPGTFPTIGRNLKKFARSASLPFPEAYLGYCSYYSREERFNLFTPSLERALIGADATSIHRDHLERVSHCDRINQMLYLDMKTYLPCLNLTYMDKMSMAHSIEVRVPYMDRRLTEFANRTAAEDKIHRLRRKHILKEAMKGVLPQEIIDRKKAGFTAPIRSWLVGDLKEMTFDLLSPERLRKRGYFNPSEVQSILNDNLSGREDNNYKIWLLLTLELWMQTFVDQPVCAAAILPKLQRREPDETSFAESR